MVPCSLLFDDHWHKARAEVRRGGGLNDIDWPHISQGFEHLSRVDHSYRIRALAMTEGTQYTIADVIPYAAIKLSFVTS